MDAGNANAERRTDSGAKERQDGNRPSPPPVAAAAKPLSATYAAVAKKGSLARAESVRSAKKRSSHSLKIIPL